MRRLFIILISLGHFFLTACPDTVVIKREEELSISLSEETGNQLLGLKVSLMEDDKLDVESDGELQTFNGAEWAKEFEGFLKSEVERLGGKPLVRIEVAPDMEQAAVVELLNALSAAKVTKITFTDTFEDE